MYTEAQSSMEEQNMKDFDVVFIGVSLLAVREQLGNGWMIGYCSVV
jgi:hypothetical protein